MAQRGGPRRLGGFRERHGWADTLRRAASGHPVCLHRLDANGHDGMLVPMNCPRCGKKSVGSDKCSWCGYEFVAPGAQSPAATPPSPAAAAAARVPAGATGPRADTARSRRDSSAAAGPVGYVKVIGDLPDGAIIWLDSTRQSGRVFRAAPGSYNLEVETEEF